VVPSSAPEPAGPIVVAAVGDLMLAGSVGRRIAADPPQDPFAAVAPILRSADLAVGNLECAIATGGTPEKKSWTFRAPPAAAEVLASAGVDVVTLANNHVLDYGKDGLKETLAFLDAAKIAHTGAGMTEADAHAPARVRARGRTLAFLGYVKVSVEGGVPGGFDTQTWEAHGDAPGVAWADPDRIASDVAAARAGGADVVIVMLHSGIEGQTAPNAWQIDAAHAAIDAGAALVIGAHPHVLQGAARYKSGFIAYSLGNFVFEGPDGQASAILRVTLDGEQPGDRVWTPVQLRYGVPQLLDSEHGAYVTGVLRALSMAL
jgi:poly-gamma-glutamate synthesis protein (capsule biosynthesis protein)